MSADIGKGDEVEAVADYTFKRMSVILVRGQLYHVDDVIDISDAVESGARKYGGTGGCIACRNREVGLLIKGIRHPSNKHPAWSALCPCRFKPIYRRKEGMFNDLLTNIPADLRERESAIAKYDRVPSTVRDFWNKLGNGNGICRGREQSGGPAQGNPAGHGPVRLPVRSGARGPS